MSTPGGEWVAVPIPGEPDRWDYVPAEQPPSPDGGPGRWHVVGGSGTEVGKWEWFPATPPPPPPPPVLMPWETEAPPAAPAPMPWETTASTPVAPAPVSWEPTPSAPAPAFGEQETAPVSRAPSPWQPAAPAPGAQQPPVFGAPAPAGWHAAPPMGAVPPKRSRKVPLIIVGVVVLLAAVGGGAVVLLGGGDGGKKNREEITALVNYVTTADEGKDVCTSHLTDEFVTTVFGDVATCEKDDDDDSGDSSNDATGATVTEIKIDKNTATANVAVIGGDTDGATGTWAFLQGEDKIWRVSDWRADYLRSSFGKTFGDKYESDGPDDPFDDVDVRNCVKDKMLGQDDLAFLDTAYKLFRNSDDSVEKLLGFMSECPSDTAGVSALRALFEKEFRESAQLPPAVTECMVLGMRTALSEDEIIKLSLNRDEPLPSDVGARIDQLALGCAGGPTAIDPRPSDFGTSPPAFGT